MREIKEPKIKNILSEYLNGDPVRARMICGGYEGRILRELKEKPNDLGLSLELRRIKFLHAGLFNKKIKF